MDVNRMNSEEKAKILDKLPGLIFRCIYEPPNFPVIFASEGAKALTGYTSQELTDGNLKFMDIVHPGYAKALEELHDTTLALGAPLEASFKIITKSGAVKQVLMRSRVSKTDENGMPHIVEGLLTDITKQLLIVAADQENREGYDIWARTGYAVRTPLNAIIGLTEIGLREEMPDIVREYTQTVKKAGVKLISIFNNAMDYSKIESGKLEIVKAEYTLSSLVRDVAEIFKGQISDTNLEFIVYIDSRLPKNLVGDVLRIRQALLILLSNAGKFTERGYVSLSIEGEDCGSAVNLRFSVEDTGRGIKEEDKSNMFEPFRQFDSKVLEGNGLGLPVARSLVKMLGGEIQVNSAYGVGSIFTIALPQEKSEGSPPLCAVNNPADKNVLIFVEGRACKDSISRTLKNLGVAYKVAASAQDFHDALTNENWSFVFTTHKSYSEFQSQYPDNPTAKPKIVLITEPIFCLQAADILNGVAPEDRKKAVVGFTAPEARVLIVDDVSANLTVAEGLLQPYKMKLDLCKSGADAIEAVKSNRYDLILMDFWLPVMDGAEAALRIKEFDDKVPIVALTANIEYASRERHIKERFDDFLPKPIHMLRLNAMLNKWLPEDKKQAAAEEDARVSSGSRFKIPGIDVKKGIATIGGSLDIYLRVLEKYFDDGHRLLKELRECLETKNVEMFRVHIHALNSISESIGASETAGAADALERAAEQENLAFIQSNSPAFLEMLEKLLENIQPVITKEKKKILLIDDTEAYLLILNDVLKSGYTTEVALSAESGIETARQTMPDLILLDMTMPEASGLEVLETLKTDQALKSIPVILMAKRFSDENREKARTLGAAGYLKKPFEKSEVKSVVASVFSN